MEYNIKELKTLLQMSQKELKGYLEEYLQTLGYLTINRQGYLYAPGTVPVLLVAHLDTVHHDKPSIICFSEDKRYVMSPQGIGGDDRCGVYMILQIIKKYNCHILFCEDEETGGKGAKEFTRGKIKKPSVNYIVEMDRHGDNDAVFYRCDNRDFSDFVFTFGFRGNYGTFSDISIIAPFLKTAAVNISAGYYNEHRTHEYIDMLAVLRNIERICKMVSFETEHFEYTERKDKCGQISLFGERVSIDTPAIDCREKRTMLMPIPQNAHLVTNGYKIARASEYLVDIEGQIFIYLPEIDAAVISEHSFACDDNGEQIVFSIDEARRLSVISMEEALERLTA